MAVQYTDLVNKSGTIYNAKTGSGYSNPDQLAADLGVSSSAINWGGIKADPNWSFSAPAAAPAAPSQSFSFMDNKVYDINKNEVTNSSTQVDNAVKNLGGDIQKSASKTPDITSLLESFKVNDENSAKKSQELNKLYDDRLKLLDERRSAEMERLNAEYGTEKLQKESDFQETVKPYKERLQRLKDTPYGPNATLEEDLKLKLAGLEKTHKLEMDTLFNRRQSSIALAQSAYEDKDFALSEAMIKNAKDSEQAMYNRSQDYYNMVLNAQEEERQKQQVEYKQQKEQIEFMNTYGITQPMFAVGSTVFNSQTLQPEYENIGGTFKRLSDGKIYGTEKEFYQDSGLTSFGQIQQIDQGGDVERKIVLDLINDYPDAPIYPGMSLAEAREVLSSSRIYQDKVRGPQGPSSSLVPKDSEVKDLLYEIKRKNSNLSWAEQWDIGARLLQEQEGLNPTNYDKVFWEIFHPDGLRGYEEKYGKQNSQDQLINAFYSAMGISQ